MSSGLSIASATPVQLVNNPGGGAGLAPGATGFSITLSVRGFLNGRVRGNANQNVAGVLTIAFGNSPTAMDLAFVATQDLTQPGFQYPFDVIILQPYLQITFVNGGSASAFFRANVQALPV